MRASAWTRPLSAEKLIDSPALNGLGLQVLRVIAARALHYAQPPVRALARSAEATLARDGIVVLGDFLQPALFARLQQEADWVETRTDALTETPSGGTRLRTVRVRDLDQGRLTATRTVLTDPRLVSLLSAAERRPVDTLDAAEFELVTCGVEPPDPEWALHSDTFFTTHKAWLYLDDVPAAAGPLAYVPGSHALTLGRLGHIYRHSRAWRPGQNASRRIGTAEAAGLEERVLACRANTLVVANTCGYHRRTAGEPGAGRRALHVSVRANPFFLPGLRARLRAGRPGVTGEPTCAD